MTPLRKLRRESMGFAIGSLFFTTAAFIQLRLSGRWWRGAWKSRADWDDWWAAAIQFAGAICFLVADLLVRPPRTAAATPAPA